MKTIEIHSDKRATRMEADTLKNAIEIFMLKHPQDEIVFAHDLKYETITKQFNPHLKQFNHESKVPTRG